MADMTPTQQPTREAMVEKYTDLYNQGVITTTELWQELELIELGFYDSKEA